MVSMAYASSFRSSTPLSSGTSIVTQPLRLLSSRLPAPLSGDPLASQTMRPV